MPAIITHYQFGHEIYHNAYESIGATKDDFDAFMLGCQGPDIMFYSVLDPTLSDAWEIGSTMHASNPNKLLAAFHRSAHMLPPELRTIGVAYFRGLLCHYCLDSAVHPLVYAQQIAYCSAGIKGLDATHDHEVHAEIESELDVLVLSTKAHMTIQRFNPAKRALNASRRTSDVVSFLYKNVALAQFGIDIPVESYTKSLDLYRSVLAVLHSPKGTKKRILGMVERIFRDHSFLEAMSHTNKLIYESSFDNREHAPWTDPGTGIVRFESFWDLYDAAQARAVSAIEEVDEMNEEVLEALTSGFNFKGEPTHALVIRVEDGA